MKSSCLLMLVFAVSACARGTIFGSSSESETQVAPSVVSESATDSQVVSRPDYVAYITPKPQKLTSQQIYTILASRTANKMLKYTASLYENARYPKLYLVAPEVEGKAVVPDNYDYAGKVTGNIIANSHSYEITDNIRNADYVLSTKISGGKSADSVSGMVVYKLTLTDSSGSLKGVWIESLSQITNDDQSWW